MRRHAAQKAVTQKLAAIPGHWRYQRAECAGRRIAHIPQSLDLRDALGQPRNDLSRLYGLVL